MSENLTEGTLEEKTGRAKRMMLWFGIVSLIMSFAGWTSAYIVSSARDDWMTDYTLPGPFWVSTVLILLSSLTYWLGKREVSRNQQKKGTIWLLITLLLGVLFIISQFFGFSEMIGMGYYFTGPTSNITLSYIFLIAAIHILHVVAGMISLLVVLFKQIRGLYGPGNMLGMELGITFWHFLDALWVYLVLFFYFFR
ncbi:cytochrome c oxidase subunit 3 [Robiginitalea aurantiaca]|uniref:Cytochrome c oxidase subunit 3 n=1 Tax=Robiginitalea aurantiaca TaxID=3056915 RepID=A0ABT7WBZ9_9FLAO|nr:cytochrome c oxidase subunit 3 [Robiginitalea aurantiaca]MDM9630433.1 cytochrome c oxidase subunit 3 [Robiginitalea aurantiaca]